ncbi:MAG: phosphonate C-P lyase system protein PhnG [Peptococcaceae bacterium]|jgi:alpha-D-ribose 1-methylphosphonate 5-triphosphate synthase subunit PhnG|nr:phosphonate C-P lyase system protein PhnG [Peptococcaceae bacterium]
MDKLTLSRAAAFADAGKLRALAEEAVSGKTVLLLKAPEKTMILLNVREPVRQSRFYLGEALAVHCMVEVDGVRGAAAQLGDDLQKVQAAAILDAAHTGRFPGFVSAEAALLELDAARKAEELQWASRVRETQVRFQALEDRVS